MTDQRRDIELLTNSGSLPLVVSLTEAGLFMALKAFGIEARKPSNIIDQFE